MQYNQVRTGQPNYSGSRYMISTAMRLCNTSRWTSIFRLCREGIKRWTSYRAGGTSAVFHLEREREIGVLLLVTVTVYDDLPRTWSVALPPARPRLPGAALARRRRAAVLAGHARDRHRRGQGQQVFVRLISSNSVQRLSQTPLTHS